MTASISTTRRALLGAVPAAALFATAPLVAQAAAPPLSEAWAAFFRTNWLAQTKLKDVALYAASLGYRFEDIVLIQLVNNDDPEAAPAIYFEKPSGGTDIVMTSGVVAQDGDRVGERSGQTQAVTAAHMARQRDACLSAIAGVADEDEVARLVDEADAWDERLRALPCTDRQTAILKLRSALLDVTEGERINTAHPTDATMREAIEWLEAHHG